jgi:hypothetical protein
VFVCPVASDLDVGSKLHRNSMVAGDVFLDVQVLPAVHAFRVKVNSIKQINAGDGHSGEESTTQTAALVTVLELHHFIVRSTGMTAKTHQDLPETMQGGKTVGIVEQLGDKLHSHVGRVDRFRFTEDIWSQLWSCCSSTRDDTRRSIIIAGGLHCRYVHTVEIHSTILVTVFRTVMLWCGCRRRRGALHQRLSALRRLHVVGGYIAGKRERT